MEVCRKYDIYMIDDEVICGFGRLGRMFGGEVLGFQADSITVAKALSSAYVPIAGVMIPEMMYQAMVDESRKIGVFGHGYTYSGHPVAAAVAIKTLEIYQRDRVIEKAAVKGEQFQRRLLALNDHPLVGEARGLGLVGGVELVSEKTRKQSFDPKKGVAGRAARHAEEEGLIVRPLPGDVLTLCPPLIISEEEIDTLFDRLTRALDRTLDWAKREQLLAA
jgi:4-aminobutyrate--pyruvate transaminase